MRLYNHGTYQLKHHYGYELHVSGEWKLKKNKIVLYVLGDFGNRSIGELSFTESGDVRARFGGSFAPYSVKAYPSEWKKE